MYEKEQQALTSQVIKELGIKPRVLWLHYVSIGGDSDLHSVLGYIEDAGTLPARERDRLACAVNDLTLEPPGLPRAPCADAGT